MSKLFPLLRLPEVQKLSGLSRSSIYRLEGKGAFPKRVRLSVRATAWRSEELLEWLDGRPRAVTAPSTGRNAVNFAVPKAANAAVGGTAAKVSA
jgi:prophage regulatory protein